MNIYTKSGLTERGRLQTQFKIAKLMYRFHKQKVTHYPGQTYNYVIKKYSNYPIIILKAMLVVFKFVNVALLGWMKHKKQRNE